MPSSAANRAEEHAASVRTFLDGRVVLHCGDCIEVLATLEAESVDSIVCDPPYHLVQNSRNGSSQPGDLTTPYGRTGPSKARGFMGKEWDGGNIAFRKETWEAAYQV